MWCKETTLSDYPDLKADEMEGVKKFMATKVRDLIRDIKHKWSQDNPDRNANEMPLPLVRLKVEITGFTNFNVQQFGQQFVGAVANPQDILIFYRKRTPTRGKGKMSIPRNPSFFFFFLADCNRTCSPKSMANRVYQSA